MSGGNRYQPVGAGKGLYFGHKYEPSMTRNFSIQLGNRLISVTVGRSIVNNVVDILAKINRQGERKWDLLLKISRL